MRFWSIVLIFMAVSAGTAELPPVVDREVDFAQDVRPLLKSRCFECHDARKQQSGFRLDRRSAAMAGGENFRPTIVPGNSADSPLIRIVAGLEDGYRMPPEGEPLSPE